MTRAFFDTNVLLYAFDSSDPRQPIADTVLAQGGVISVQSLNEFAHVARRKLQWDWETVQAALAAVRRAAIQVVPLTTALHKHGLDIAAAHRLSIYDAMIVAAALTAGCDTLYSEDMHDGLLIDGRLRVVNPFRDLTR